MKEFKSVNEVTDFLNEGKRILKFSATWCGPCRIMAQTLNSLDDDDIKDIVIGEIDVDDELFSEIVDYSGIKNIPTLIFYENGKEVNRIIGNVSKEAIINKINESYGTVNS